MDLLRLEDNETSSPNRVSSGWYRQGMMEVVRFNFERKYLLSSQDVVVARACYYYLLCFAALLTEHYGTYQCLLRAVISSACSR